MTEHEAPPSGEVDAMLLLGRSGYQGAPGEGIEALAGAVHTAVAERGFVSMPDGREACARAGARKIMVVPVFFGRDRSMARWLSKAAVRWSRDRDGPEVVFAGATGEHPALWEAVVRAEAEGGAPARADDFRSLEDPPAWPEIPPQRRHVLACLGPRCTSRGAGNLYVHLHKRLRDRRLWGPDGVHAVQTGCLSPCNPGPTMVVYPEGIRYCGLTEEAIDRIADEHFVGGEVVEEYARGRHERPERGW